MAMDEFHFYSDPDRGWAWQVPLLTLPHTQFLLMSATLGDVSQIAQALESKTGTTVEKLVLEHGLMNKKEMEEVLNPQKMTGNQEFAV